MSGIHWSSINSGSSCCYYCYYHFIWLPFTGIISKFKQILWLLVCSSLGHYFFFFWVLRILLQFCLWGFCLFVLFISILSWFLYLFFPFTHLWVKRSHCSYVPRFIELSQHFKIERYSTKTHISVNYPKIRQQTNKQKKNCVEPSSSCPRTKGVSFPLVHKFPLCLDSPPQGQGVHIYGSVLLLLLIQIYFLYSIYLYLCFLLSLVLKGIKCEASNDQPITCALNSILFLYIQRFCTLSFSLSTGLFLSHCKNAVISSIFKILHFFHIPHQTTASFPFHNKIATSWCMSCISSLSYSLFKATSIRHLLPLLWNLTCQSNQ